MSTDGLDHRGRMLEVFTVIVLGMATVASAWCAFQASRWNDTETDEARDATDARVEQSRLYSQGTQTVVYDSTIVAAYASAVASKNVELQQFFRDSLIREEFLPIVDEWERQKAGGSADLTSLFENEDYLTSLFSTSRAVEDEVIAASARADVAGGHADQYLMTTLFMASALFLAGVVSSFKARTAQVMLLTGAVLLLALGAARIVDLPVA
jgi:hypothetical protein